MIIDLYWAREERALEETERKYGGYCRSIARNILKNPDDTDDFGNTRYKEVSVPLGEKVYTIQFTDEGPKYLSIELLRQTDGS